MAGGVTLRGSLSDMTRRRRLLAVVGAASLIYLAALAYYAMVRSIDTDEGYYVSAARLVWEGKVPYRDFFFPQLRCFPISMAGYGEFIRDRWYRCGCFLPG
jgi:hypothetical protein